MNRKLLLGLRFTLPFIANILLFFIIFNTQKGSDYALSDTFFYLGVFNILYGGGALLLGQRSGVVVGGGKFSGRLGGNLSLAEHDAKKYHKDGGAYSTTLARSIGYIKLVYIIIGVLFVITSAFL